MKQEAQGEGVRRLPSFHYTARSRKRTLTAGGRLTIRRNAPRSETGGSCWIVAGQGRAKLDSCAMVDFQDQLRRQLQFLRSSCRLYDEGHVEEAIRIAVTLRVLFHDTPRSISLLQHLRRKSISMLSTAELCGKAENHHLALIKTLVRIPDARYPNITCEMQPALDDLTRREIIPFRRWWIKEPIILFHDTGVLNRRDLILAAANKDGGAHVDAALEPTYDKARLGGDITIEIDFKNPPVTAVASAENVHFASLRQIGYEVLNSSEIEKLK